MNGSGKQSFYEIQLSNSSLIVAFVIAVAIGIAVFMLGVMVGRQQAPGTVSGLDLVENFTAGETEAAPATADLLFDNSVREPTGSEDQTAVAPTASPPQVEEQPATEPVETAPQAPSLPAHDPNIATGYVVQVRATDKRPEADALQAALASAGFPAFVVSGEVEGTVVFRVRVGRYDNRSDAERVASLLDERSDVLETWITQG